MRFVLTMVAERFFEGRTLADRHFEADDDATAIWVGENNDVAMRPLRFVMPDGETCAAHPRKLVDVTDEAQPRVVKEWA